MNLADTSLLAYDALDLAACERELLNWFMAQPRGYAATRHVIADLMHKDLSWVCGRAKALIDADVLESLKAVNGRHPLKLQEYTPGATRSYESINGTAPLAAARSAPDLSAVPVRANSANRQVQKGEIVNLAGVIPHLPHRQSMSLAEAQRSTGLEAELVRKAKRQFRIWGENIQFCADVDALIHAPDRVAA